MANRVVYGLSNSSNGWPMVDEGSCTWVKIPGTSVTLQIQNGQPLAILRAFAADFNAYVEPLRDPDSACWTPTNSVASSNHLSGTGMDLNWNSHPFQKRGTFTAAQLSTIRELQDFYEGTVFWGGDWGSPVDEMHWQLSSLANGGDINTFNNPHTQDFINRKIRPDGYSTFRRGSAPSVDAAQVLSDAMGGRLSLDRYRQLLPAVTASLLACDCTNVNRIAMWCAQIGHESAGLYYTEEIASGAAYEGRTDLGNTQPGDGVRFKGRSWIQITGRSNYTRLSQWAFSKGLVPSATYFVDNPPALASDEYAGLGAAWYWSVARPDINTLCDNRDLVTVTKRINGGTNGLADRQTRYNRALAMGEQLLALINEGDDALADPDVVRKINEIHACLFNRIPSQSKYRTAGEGAKWQLHELLKNDDAMIHEMLVERQAMMGNPEAVALVKREADKGDKWAQSVYAYLTGPEV
ncbi:hypothetical protein A5742_27515 [Mycolicibacterium fortuitum]|uniref:Peptidase M15C domain-containing protein n=1 Tax=Mycolicibacterium fortuitum TaxID=1766 RepID=A0ABD6QM72_MYCFO|nr:M15 family metallopeptidase [Mycolicibacterium fortuitum]OMC44723.1 hypothetical protein A5742_27515 [Mycolicibacterium fortuitum]